MRVLEKQARLEIFKSSGWAQPWNLEVGQKLLARSISRQNNAFNSKWNVLYLKSCNGLRFLEAENTPKADSLKNITNIAPGLMLAIGLCVHFSKQYSSVSCTVSIIFLCPTGRHRTWAYLRWTGGVLQPIDIVRLPLSRFIEACQKHFEYLSCLPPEHHTGPILLTFSVWMKTGFPTWQGRWPKRALVLVYLEYAWVFPVTQQCINLSIMLVCFLDRPLGQPNLTQLFKSLHIRLLFSVMR